MCCRRCSIKVTVATALLLFSPVAQEGQRYPLSPRALFFATLIGPLLPPLLGHYCHPYWATATALIGPLLLPLLGHYYRPYWDAAVLLGLPQLPFLATAPLATLLLSFKAPSALSVTLFKALFFGLDGISSAYY